MTNKKQYMREYREKNKDRINQQRKEYYAKNKERIKELKKQQYNPQKHKDARLKKQYGITLEEYEQKLIAQKYKCACCGTHVDEIKTTNNQFGSKNLVVDHCHTTGNVRDLLCNRCNTVIGMVNEDEQVLYFLEMYIVNWKEQKAGAEGNSNVDP